MKNIKSLYIHIPFCISKCKYCDFFSITSLEKSHISEDYIDALCNEISFRLKKYGISELKTVYIGGGTPSLLTENQLEKIQNSIAEVCKLSPDYEFTIEMNPDDITEELLLSLKKQKVNRISVGIQSMNDDCLKFAGRRASLEQNIKALGLLKSCFPEFSVDVICGLPYETEKSFLNGLEHIISFNPEHISMYSLTIEETTPFGIMAATKKLKLNQDFSDDLWLKARDFLEEQGYRQYEVSNFARNNKQCCHNLVYWTHNSYVGCGSGGTGTVYNDMGEGERWTNSTDVSSYIEFWKKAVPNKNITEYNGEIPEQKEFIDSDTSRFEFFMMSLRKLSGFTEKDYFESFKEKLPESFTCAAEKWNTKKLMSITNEHDTTRYALNGKGILFLNSFLEEL